MLPPKPGFTLTSLSLAVCLAVHSVHSPNLLEAVLSSLPNPCTHPHGHVPLGHAVVDLPAQRRHEGRLPTPRGPHDRMHLPVGKLPSDLVQQAALVAGSVDEQGQLVELGKIGRAG